MAVGNVQRLARIALNCRAPKALADFFVRALGFSQADPSFEPVQGVDNLRLKLGASRLALNSVGPDARDYPAALPGWNPLFQHFAIVTADMGAAFARLRQTAGWTAISEGGPQQLPLSAGGVTAFKFRDPDGHPLELICFPGGDPTPRIDHSAISVADTARSIAFYQALGLTVGSRSINHGPEQDRLDGLRGADVEVTGLMPRRSPAPHIELLCYRGDHCRGNVAGPGDVAATRLVLTVSSGQELDKIRADPPGSIAAFHPGVAPALLLRDPDGHLLQIEIEA